MSERIGVFALLCAALFLTAACSSGGNSFNSADLNPFADNCGCEPQPEPCGCDPTPVAQPCDPCATNAGQRPPDARPGEVWCYVRVPAITKTVCEQFCVQPERCDKVWVEPVTKQVTERVCTCPEKVNCRTIPAVYKDVCNQVCTAPARTEWRKVDCQAKESLKPQEQIGECWTLVEIPPCYKSVTTQVCTCPEKTVNDVIPAVFEDQCKTVVCQPGYYKSVPVPAVFETRSREEVVCGPRWEWRRTCECEVPEVVGSVGGNQGYSTGSYTDDGNMIPPLDSPAPDLDPIDSVPPAGDLPPLDPLQPVR